jgi:Glycosyl hydrolases family 16
MKYALALLVLAVGMCRVPAVRATASATPPVPVKSLIFGDEFNGPAGTRPRHRLWGVKSYDNWSGWSHIAQNGKGSVVLTAYKDSSGWHTPWLSGKIGYRGPRYVEARADVPCGAGTWAAPIWEWAYPHGRAPGFENDVAEQFGAQPTRYYASLHYWTSGGRNRNSSKRVSKASPLCGTFHTYGAAVFSNRVVFYLDGARTTSIRASAVGLSRLTKWKEVVNIDLALVDGRDTSKLGRRVVLAVDFIHVYAM